MANKRPRSTPATFRERVFAAVRTIPSGCTRTYKDVATEAGNPLAARAVGAILHTNHDPDIPCHRVVRTDGTPGGYNRGTARKIQMLAVEKRARGARTCH